MPRITVRIPAARLHQLEALATQRHSTVSDVIRDALDHSNAPQTPEMCARHFLQCLDTEVAGLEAYVLGWAGRGRHPLPRLLAYLVLTGLCAIEAGYRPSAPPAGTPDT